MNAPLKSTLALSGVMLLGASSHVFSDYSVVLGPPTTLVVMQGDYLSAADAAYNEWLRERPPATSISNRKVTISPEPGTHLIYVRFSRLHTPAGSIEDCDAPLYAYDTQVKKIIWKDKCGFNRNATPH